MENLFMFLATTLALRISSKKQKRFLIGTTNTSSLLFTAGKEFFTKCTPEGDRVYFNDHTYNGVTYGLICIVMKGSYTLEQAENILGQYINKMKKPFKICHNVSVEMNRHAGSVSATDYWQDERGFDWKIKGYTNGGIVAVLYVKNISATSVQEHDTFLNGFKFCGTL